MIVGVPKEIKSNEDRVAITPAGVSALVKRGHKVIIEKSAGVGSGFSDESYVRAGAEILDTPQEVFEKADLILKVKEPQPSEYGLLKRNQVLFTYLHLAAEKELTRALMERGVVAVGYETVQLDDGTLPLLVPMSEIAGRMSVLVGAQLLTKHCGGKGVLLPGVPGVPPAQVVIIGGGTVGLNAAKMAVGLGAEVTVVDINVQRLRYLDDIFGARVKTLAASEYEVKKAVAGADLLIGAVLVPGSRAPKVVTEEMVTGMSEGSVIVDIAIDQGGCVETVDRVTTHAEPTYVKYGVVHYSVANIPGAVAGTATLALTNATLPYVLKLADKGFAGAVAEDQALARGVNVIDCRVTCEGVAQAFGCEYVPLSGILN